MGDAIAFLTTFGRKGGTLRAGAFGWFPLVGAALVTSPCRVEPEARFLPGRLT